MAPARARRDQVVVAKDQGARCPPGLAKKSPACVPPGQARNGLVGPGGSGVAAYGAVISAYGCTNLLANLVIGSRPMPARPGRQAQTLGAT